VKKFARLNDPESYAGGSYAPGSPHVLDNQRVGARRSTIPGPARWGLGVELMPQHGKSTVMRPLEIMEDERRARPTEDCKN
jgi:hypothetical protein